MSGEQFADPRQTREFALLLGEGANYPRLMAQYLETVIEPAGPSDPARKRRLHEALTQLADRLGWAQALVEPPM